MRARTLSLAFLFTLSQPAPAGAEIPAELVTRLKPTVVSIQVTRPIGLNLEEKSSGKATGFVVDAQRGIIATNRHVAGASPGRYKIIFDNGQTAEARRLHYDAWHDFALLQVDPSRLDFALAAAPLGESSSLSEQDEILLIGNAKGDEYSIKFGRVSNLVLNKGERHSATLQTTIDRAGGASGSPVFNAKGQVVAIHYKGNESNSFELRIDYLSDALGQLRRSGAVRRGDVGLQADLILVSDAQKHFHLPQQVAQRVLGLRRGLKRMLVVGRCLPRSPVRDRLLPGDLLLTVDGAWIGDDLYRLDRLIDEKTGGQVELGVMRNGRQVSFRVAVRDAEAQKVRRFVKFAGGTLQDATPELLALTDEGRDGVFLVDAEPGSSMHQLKPGRPVAALIEGVNGVPTPSLEAFTAAVRQLKDGDHVYFVVRHIDGTQAVPVTMDLRFAPLQGSAWSQKVLDWLPDDK